MGGNGGVYSTAYGYLANSDLLLRTTNLNGGTPVSISTRQWDFGYRLRSISSAAGGSVVSSHSYLYDDLDRRTHAYLEDGSLWLYGYNDRDELIRGQRYWSDWSPVTGQRFEYAYDAIGNRVTAASGGDTAGGNLRTSSYTPNQLNQYTTVVTPGFKDVSGAAWATSTVTVNGGATDRKGEYWHRELGVSNGSSPVWQSVTATTGTTSSNGGFVLPRSSQSITHDLDGNLSFDGVWSYQWTAENRLASMAMTNVSGIANSNRLKLDFVYDHEGRRAGKIVSAWNGSGFANPVTNRFINENWRVFAEVNSGGSPTRSYMWGLDLSGTLDDGGGVGGLLMVRDHSGGSYHFAAYDGNGNVAALVNAADQSTSARYEYSPFLEPIRASGPTANVNSIWGSSKIRDSETGLSYFGERYYSVGAGRWLTRDPLEEDGGINLYAFVGNSALNSFDPFGLETLISVGGASNAGQSIEGGSGAQALSLYHRVKKTVESFNELQDFASQVMDAATGDVSGIADVLLRASNNSFATWGKKNKGHQLHHIFPQGEEFADYWKRAEIDVDRFAISLTKKTHGLLHNGKGRGRGGTWNRAWSDFFKREDKAGRKMPDKDRIFDFASRMIEKFGFGGEAVVPYSRRGLYP